MANNTFQQKYPNNTRTISGVVNLLKQDDVVVLCNTTTGPVELELLTPSTISGVGYWSTQYKVYILDNGNNASVNNIKVNAPAGVLINGASSFTINTNGASLLLRISSNTNYIGQYSVIGGGSGYSIIQDEGVSLPQRTKINFTGGGVTASDDAINGATIVNILPGNLINLTYAQAIVLIAANNLIAGAFYNITDATTSYLVSGGIILQATSNNTFSLQGKGIFLNADYDGVGDYTGSSVPYSGNNQGVWAANLPSMAIGDVVIYDNLNFINQTGVNGVTNPIVDTTNWLQLPKSKTTGYIQEIDVVTYDFANNILRSRQDKRNNYIEWSPTAGSLNLQPLISFQWGRTGAYSNKIINGSIFEGTNSRTLFYGNLINNGRYSCNAEFSFNQGFFAYNVIEKNGEVLLFDKCFTQIFQNTISGGKPGSLTIYDGSAGSAFYQNNIENGYVVIQAMQPNSNIILNEFLKCDFTISTKINSFKNFKSNTITNGAVLVIEELDANFEDCFIAGIILFIMG